MIWIVQIKFIAFKNIFSSAVYIFLKNVDNLVRT